MQAKEQADQWNPVEVQDIDPHTCGHLIFEEEDSIDNGKKTPYSTNDGGQTGWLHVEES